MLTKQASRSAPCFPAGHRWELPGAIARDDQFVRNLPRENLATAARGFRGDRVRARSDQIRPSAPRFGSVSDCSIGRLRYKQLRGGCDGIDHPPSVSRVQTLCSASSFRPLPSTPRDNARMRRRCPPFNCKRSRWHELLALLNQGSLIVLRRGWDFPRRDGHARLL